MPVAGGNRAGDSRWQVKHEEQIDWDKCRKIHATGSSPSGSGTMQPEGHPQLNKPENVTWHRC